MSAGQKERKEGRGRGKKSIFASEIRRPSITVRREGRHVEPVGRLNPSASFRKKNKMINLITNVGVAHQTNEPEWGKKEADLALVTRSLFWMFYAICEALSESRNRWRAC